MNEQNPLETHCAPADVPMTDIELSHVVSGQRLMLYSIVTFFVGNMFSLGSISLLAHIVLALIGVIRVATGLRWPFVIKIGVSILMFIPLVNLVPLLVVNAKATKSLRNAGCRIGFLGATKPTP